jgi:hypothetical protein
MRRYIAVTAVLAGNLALGAVAFGSSATSPSGLVQTFEVSLSSSKPGHLSVADDAPCHT